MIVMTIVLNWNRRDDTLECLASMVGQEIDRSNLDHRLLLIDNGSTDGSVDAIRAAFPDVEVIALPENRGYAAGVNLGVRRALAAGADWTLLLNNDTVAAPDLLARLLAAVEEPAAGPATGSAVGLLAPTVTYFDAPDTVWPSAGRRRRLTLAASDTTASPPSLEPYAVDWATGCCLLVRRAVWETVGPLDERFRVYYEDHDFCLRARAAGWRILHVPRAAIRHRVARSTGTGSPEQMYLLARSSVPYFLIHTHGLHRLFIVAYRAGSLVRTLVATTLVGRPDAGAAYLRGIRDGLRDVGGFGGSARLAPLHGPLA
jgi:GT2 family glycosyltransferase